MKSSHISWHGTSELMYNDVGFETGSDSSGVVAHGDRMQVNGRWFSSAHLRCFAEVEGFGPSKEVVSSLTCVSGTRFKPLSQTSVGKSRNLTTPFSHLSCRSLRLSRVQMGCVSWGFTCG